jgi:hypothetical protein
MKKKVSQDYSFCEQFYAVLITSRLPEHQLAWSLNSHLRLNFRKLSDLMVFHPKKTERIPHSLFCWSSPNAIDYFLVTSSEKSTSLLSETFLLVEKRERRATVEQLVEKISPFEFIFSIEEIPFKTPATTPKQRNIIDQLSNIAIDMEEHLDTLRKEQKYYLK